MKKVEEEVACGARFRHPSADANDQQSHPVDSHLQQVSRTPVAASGAQRCYTEADAERNIHQSPDHCAAHGAEDGECVSDTKSLSPRLPYTDTVYRQLTFAGRGADHLPTCTAQQLQNTQLSGLMYDGSQV